MKSLLFSLDYVYKQDGTLTPVELNTNTGTELPIGVLTVDNFLSETEGFYDHSSLHTFLQTNSITSIKTIAVEGTDDFFRVFAEYYGYAYELVKTNSNDVTIPEVEDDDTTLIIRIAYDTYSIVDDLYARDNYEFLNLIRNENFASPVAFSSESLDTISSIELSQEGITPNYVVKHRTPGYDKSVWPKLYKLDTQEELDSLKLSLSDEEYLQKFECNLTSSFIDDRVTFLRSLNLVIGGTLDTVLNICNYTSVNRLSKSNTLLQDSTPVSPTSKLLSPIESSKFYPTFYVRAGFSYHHDETDFALGYDDTLVDFSNIQIGTELKDIVLSETLTQGGIGTLDDLSNFTISGSNVFATQTRTEGGIFVNIVASNEEFGEFTWYDGIDNKYLTQPDEGSNSIRYISGGEIEVGDKIFMYDKNSNTIKPLEVSSIAFDFKPINTYRLTLTPRSEFFVQLKTDTNLFLIQHNTCFSGCVKGSGSCTYPECQGCGKNSSGCLNCGGTDFASCEQK